MTDGTVRCVEFAVECGVDRSAVSRWIAQGKIGPDAIVGEGRKIRLRPDVARRHLKERLDPTQRFGLNGVSTRLEPAAPKTVDPELFRVEPPANREPPPAPAFDGSVEARIKAEKLRQAELSTRRQEEEDRRARGIYIMAVDAKAATTRACAKLLEAIEGSLSDIAGEFASKYQIPNRDALHLLRGQFNKVRARVSQDFAEIAAALPETIEDDGRHD